MKHNGNTEITGIHKLPLYGAFGVAVLTLVLVTVFVFSGAKPVAIASSPVIEARELLFRDGTNGEVLVYDAETRQKLASFGKGDGAFLRISMRGMTRKRISGEHDLASPYTLVKTEDGNLYVKDPLSSHKIRINAFGSVAIENFSQFLEHDYSEKGAEG